MLTHHVELTVSGVRAKQLYDFLIKPNDQDYRAWWPGVHFQFHVNKPGKDSPLGDAVYFDESIGDIHWRFHAVVTAARPPKQIVWRMKKVVLLPACLDMRLEDSPDGVRITHTVKAGYGGVLGHLTDPVIGLYLNQHFNVSLESHCREEWPKLAHLLSQRERPDASM